MKINNLYIKRVLNRLKTKYINDKLRFYPMPPKEGTFWRHKDRPEIVVEIISPSEWANLRLSKSIHNIGKGYDQSDHVKDFVNYDRSLVYFRSLVDKSFGNFFDDDEVVNFYNWFEEISKEEASLVVLGSMK